VVNIRVAGLRVPARLGLALLAALERGADGETSGLRLVERIRCPSQHGAAICTHFEPSAPKFVSLSLSFSLIFIYLDVPVFFCPLAS